MPGCNSDGAMPTAGAKGSDVGADLSAEQLVKRLTNVQQDEEKSVSCKLDNLYPEPMWRYLDLFHMTDLAWPSLDVCHCDSSLPDDYIILEREGGKKSLPCTEGPKKTSSKIISVCENARAKGESSINQYPTSAY